MNFLDALRTEKRILRKGWIQTSRVWIGPYGLSDCITLRVCDIFADDWVVDEKAISLTAEQLKSAWTKIKVGQDFEEFLVRLGF